MGWFRSKPAATGTAAETYEELAAKDDKKPLRGKERERLFDAYDEIGGDKAWEIDKRRNGGR